MIKTMLIFARHWLNSIELEGPLTKTTLNYEVHIYCIKGLGNRMKGSRFLEEKVP